MDSGINLGDMRARVTLQKKTDNRNQQGGINPSWADKTTFWAKVEPVSGVEYYQAQQVRSTVTHIVTLRSCVETRGITQSDRFKYVKGGVTRYLNVEIVKMIEERNRWVECQCVEQTT